MVSIRIRDARFIVRRTSQLDLNIDVHSRTKNRCPSLKTLTSKLRQVTGSNIILSISAPGNRLVVPTLTQTLLQEVNYTKPYFANELDLIIWKTALFCVRDMSYIKTKRYTKKTH